MAKTTNEPVIAQLSFGNMYNRIYLWNISNRIYLWHSHMTIIHPFVRIYAICDVLYIKTKLGQYIHILNNVPSINKPYV